MEGRHPPPRASYPYPDIPEMKRFWSNPRLYKAFFKFAASYTCIHLGVLFIVYQFTKNDHTVFNPKVSKEEFEKRIELANSMSKIRPGITPVSFNLNRVTAIKPNAQPIPSNRTMDFDDGIEFQPRILVDR